MTNIELFNVPTRFFAYGHNELNELDIIEIQEPDFVDLAKQGYYAIDYERNTVFANGVNQICLTVQNINDPLDE